MKKHVCIILILLFIITSCSLNDILEKTYTNINCYELYYGKEGKYKNLYIGYNDIFPNNIIDNCTVKKFFFKKFVSGDNSYLGYLIIQYNDDSYINEMNRLKKIVSTIDYHVYGIEGFSKNLCAIYADEHYGLIYAISNDNRNEISYVDIQFCNKAIDIDYLNFINNDDLPIGFNLEIIDWSIK